MYRGFEREEHIIITTIYEKIIILFPHLCSLFTYLLFHPFCFGIFSLFLTIFSKTNKNMIHKTNTITFTWIREITSFILSSGFSPADHSDT